MNQKAKIGLTLLGAGVAAYAYGVFDASQKLQFGNAKLVSKKFRLTDFSLLLELPIINNENIQLPFERFDGDLLYNNHSLAKITIQKYENGKAVSMPIKPKSTVILPVEIKINYFKAAGEIQDMVQSRDFLGALLIKGDIKSLGLLFPTSSKIF